jgi:hypothetical protein
MVQPKRRRRQTVRGTTPPLTTARPDAAPDHFHVYRLDDVLGDPSARRVLFTSSGFDRANNQMGAWVSRWRQLGQTGERKVLVWTKQPPTQGSLVVHPSGVFRIWADSCDVGDPTSCPERQEGESWP